MTDQRVHERRRLLALLAVAALTIAAAVAVAILAGGNVPARVNIQAVTARGVDEVFAVGGTEDARGRLVVAHSTDAGASWRVWSPPAPALTRIAGAGERLVGSITCLPPSAGGVPLEPAPTTCMYASDDNGASWRDLEAGRLVDPTFADTTYGWAHSQFPTGLTLYETTDGGASWVAIGEPCPAETPAIYSAVTTARRAGYILCYGRPEGNGQRWAFVERSADGEIAVRYEGRTSGGEPHQGLFDDFVQGFTMRPSGSGLLWASHALYRTADHGSSWEEVPVSGPERGTFWGGGVIVNDELAYLVRRSNRTAIVANEGGNFRTLISWGLFGGLGEIPSE